MYNLLTREKRGNLSFLDIEDIPWPQKPGGELTKFDLKSCDRFGIEIENVELGSFVECDENFYNQEIEHFKYSSLVAIKHGNGSVLDACFIPLVFEITSGMEAAIEIIADGDAKKYPLASISCLSPELNIGRVDFINTSFNARKELLEFDIPGQLLGRHDFLKKKYAVRLLINGEPVLSGHNQKNRLRFHSEDFILIRARGDRYLDLDKIGQTGHVSLFLSVQGKKIREPIAKWRKRVENIALPQNKNFTTIGAD